MIRQKTQLETKVNDKDHIFQCDPNSPLADVLQAIEQFRSYVYGRIKEAEDQKNVIPEEPKSE